MDRSPTGGMISNFGRNYSFRPLYHETPADEAAVLELLKRHRGRRFKAHGSLHAWSSVAITEEVSVDLRQLNSVTLRSDGDVPAAIVGGGCPIQKLVDELNRHGWTTPSIGLITQQTIAGATSTATHGSGRHCLSYYILAMRIATYDSEGEPIIREISSGQELKAARCALGNLGIITAITISIRPQYQVEEHFRRYETVQKVIDAEADYPIQQFFYVPWNWCFFAQHRKETTATRSWSADLYRWFWLLAMDRGLHWIVILLVRWSPDVCTRWFFRWCVVWLIPRGWRVVDRSDRQLTMQHQLFRHIETEMFVKQSDLGPMLSLTRWLLEWCAGSVETAESEWSSVVKQYGLQDCLDAARGVYRHHYPICIRKVLPDDGLISMSGGGGDEPWYAVSFISYARPDDRAGFFGFAEALIRLSGRRFQARPHWGKYQTLSPDEALQLYPSLPEFNEIRKTIDPTRAFQSNWWHDFPATTKAT